MKNKKKSGWDPLLLWILAGALVIAFLELRPPRYSADETVQKLLSTAVTRLIGVAVFLPVALRSGYRVYGFSARRKGYALRITLPALLVVINNLPIIGLWNGDAYLVKTGGYLWLYALESFSIGLFEELAFRGVLFPAVLEKRRESTRSIFLATAVSSAVFGGIHLINLAAGASFGSVILQIGYSFLIGGMCAAVLLHTGCVWICVLLHAVFDFCGYLVPTLGEGRVWDGVTVALTAVLGVAVLLHYLFVMRGTNRENMAAIFPENGAKTSADKS